jgi:cell division protein FtsB
VNKDLQMQLEQLKKRNPITEPIKRRLLPWKITIILAGLALDAWTILKVFGKI